MCIKISEKAIHGSFRVTDHNVTELLFIEVEIPGQ